MPHAAAARRPRQLIVGGVEAIPFAYPFLLSLHQQEAREDWQHKCGAALIHPEWALTAAHCFGKSLGEAESAARTKLHTFEIQFLEHRIKTGPTAEAACSQRLALAAVRVHPDFDGTTHHSDIALVRLAAPVACAVLNHASHDPHMLVMLDGLHAPSRLSAAAAAAASSHSNYTGVTLSIAGWGGTYNQHNKPWRCYNLNGDALRYYYDDDISAAEATVSRCEANPHYGLDPGVHEGDVMPDALLHIAAVPQITAAACVSFGAGLFDNTVQLCAANLTGGRDACHGDSGGPLFLGDGTDSARQTQVGIVSYGTGCGRPNSPGYYTRVAAFIDWVLTELEISIATLKISIATLKNSVSPSPIAFRSS